MIDERCPHIARVVDHIRPVYPGMPDAEFYDRRNLRAACVPHNVARGFERFERRHATRPLDTTSPPTLFGDYAQGQAVIDPQDAALVPRHVRIEALYEAEQAVGRVLARHGIQRDLFGRFELST